MYEEFFHLSKAPFAMTPDPEFLFLAPTHREALAGLLFTVMGRRGTAVLTGEVGTGKTTLLRKLIQSVPAEKVQFCSIFSTNISPSEFFELIMVGFGLPLEGDSKAQRLLRFWEFLMDCEAEGKTPVLLIDEAHKLTADLLEEVRLLTNFETAEHKLLQVVLAGQTELRELLRREDLRQFRQRVSVRVDLVPLQIVEIDQYMRHRWHHGGGNGNFPFNPAAVELVARYSHGIPRVMNAICDIALLRAYTAETAAIGPETVREALGVLELADPMPEIKPVAAPLQIRLPRPAALEAEAGALLRLPEDPPAAKRAAKPAAAALPKPAPAPRTRWWAGLFSADRSKA